MQRFVAARADDRAVVVDDRRKARTLLPFFGERHLEQPQRCGARPFGNKAQPPIVIERQQLVEFVRGERVSRAARGAQG